MNIIFAPAIAIAVLSGSEWQTSSDDVPSVSDEVRVQSMPPALELSDLLQAPEDAETSWEALRGNVVVLDFWATWCVPCIAAIPHMNDLADTFRDDPVVFIAITNEARETVENFHTRREMKAWIGIDKNDATFQAFGIRSIPRVVVVDRSGVIAFDDHPRALTEEVINALLQGRRVELERSKDRSVSIVAGLDPDHPREQANGDSDALLRIILRAGAGSGVAAMSPGRYTADGVSLRNLISSAYGISNERIVGLDAHEDETYVMVVSTPHRDMRLMRSLMQTSLETAFEFKVERAQREHEVLELRRPEDGQHKLVRSSNTQGGGVQPGPDRITAVNVSMSQFGRMLENLAGQPVYIDPAWTDRYDLTLQFDRDIRTWDDHARVDHLATMIHEQLGLQLVPAVRMIELVVVSYDDTSP